MKNFITIIIWSAIFILIKKFWGIEVTGIIMGVFLINAIACLKEE